MKAHFQGSFDISKYGLRLSTTRESLEKRKDKVFFERLASKLDAQRCYELFMYNIASNPNCLAYELSGADAYEFYVMYCGRLDVMHNIFSEDLDTIFNLLIESGKKFKELFTHREGMMPVIAQLVMQGRISLESFIILDELFHFLVDINNTYQDDLLWTQWNTKITQYRKLIQIDSKKAKELFGKAKTRYIIQIYKTKKLNKLE